MGEEAFKCCMSLFINAILPFWNMKKIKARYIHCYIIRIKKLCLNLFNIMRCYAKFYFNISELSLAILKSLVSTVFSKESLQVAMKVFLWFSEKIIF